LKSTLSIHPAVVDCTLFNSVGALAPGWLCGWVDPENGHAAAFPVVVVPEEPFELEPHAARTLTSRTNAPTVSRVRVLAMFVPLPRDR
jgi:hypothetical protein